MRRNPNVDLLESLLQDFFDVAHLLPILSRVAEIEPHSDQAIFVNRALVEPVSADNHGIGAGRAETRDKFVVCLNELLIFDCPAVIVEQGQ